MFVNVQKLGSATSVDVLECSYPVSAGVGVYAQALIEHTCRLVCVCLYLSAQCCVYSSHVYIPNFSFMSIDNCSFKCKFLPMCVSIAVSRSIHISVPSWNNCLAHISNHTCKSLSNSGGYRMGVGTSKSV